MKVLLTASVLSHIALFHQQLINMLRERGHIVHVAASDDLANKDGLTLDNVDHVFNITFLRNPFHLSNISAYRKLRQIIDSEGYDIIHAHTPAVGVLTRLAARQSRQQRGTEVFYTAHGFHFYQGASWLNWLLYYPVEKFMCRYTDTLITINAEDTRVVREHFVVRGFHMHGMGADSQRFFPVSAEEKQTLRQELGLPPEHRIILFAGELIPNKNQATLIKAASILKQNHPHLKILLVGNGHDEHKLSAQIAKLHLEDVIHLLGHKTNIHAYMQAADIIVSCSIREGLGLSLIEGMMTGKPVVASDNRGHREFIQEGGSGFLVPATNASAYAERISLLLNDETLYHSMAQAAMQQAHLFADTRVRPELETLYELT